MHSLKQPGQRCAPCASRHSSTSTSARSEHLIFGCHLRRNQPVGTRRVDDAMKIDFRPGSTGTCSGRTIYRRSTGTAPWGHRLAVGSQRSHISGSEFLHRARTDRRSRPASTKRRRRDTPEDAVSPRWRPCGPSFACADAVEGAARDAAADKLPIFLPPEHAPRMQIRYICGAAGVMHRTAKGKPVWKSNLGAPLSTRHIPMTSRRLRLLDGVELLRHRRHVAHVIASARWRRGLRSSPAMTLRIS